MYSFGNTHCEELEDLPVAILTFVVLAVNMNLAVSINVNVLKRNTRLKTPSEVVYFTVSLVM